MNRLAKPAQLLYAPDRRTWRSWLRAHSQTEKAVWLVYYKKNTGKPRILYNDAVEEALCVGWIDSSVNAIDEEKFAQKFTPRNPGSPYSQANKERLRALIERGRVVKAVLETLPDLGPKRFKVPPDILKALKANPTAWKNFRRFSPSYKRIRTGFIEGARNRPGEFRKRLDYFIRMTEKNRIFGFGGIEKHY